MNKFNLNERIISYNKEKCLSGKSFGTLLLRRVGKDTVCLRENAVVFVSKD